MLSKADNDVKHCEKVNLLLPVEKSWNAIYRVALSKIAISMQFRRVQPKSKVELKNLITFHHFSRQKQYTFRKFSVCIEPF